MDEAPEGGTLPTKTQRKMLEAAEGIFFQAEPDSSDLIFSAREIVQATLPHTSPRGNPPEWHRTNGNYTLSIRPGYKTDSHTRERVCIGYPYGTIPRLLLFWITTEALRTKNRRLGLGDTLASFVRQIGLNPDTGGGPRSDSKRLRNQMERLFRSTISFDYSAAGHTTWLDMQVAPKGELWWDPKKPEQPALFGSWIELGEQFYEAIIAYPIPLDFRALRAMKNSPMALDLYAWVSYRNFRIGQSKDRKPVFVSWSLLQQQFGADYKDIDNFKKKLKAALRKVRSLYRDLRVEDVPGGLRLTPSRSLISPR